MDMLSRRWRFQQLAKRFERLVRDLNDSEDTEQRKDYLLQMKAILNEVDELTLRAIPRWNST
jgi:chemotaxis protein histidine kinase CheA